MVEELDPGLEAALRSLLRREADALPFALRPGDVQRIRAERARARRTQRSTVVGAAAALVLAVGGLALASVLRPSGPATSPGENLAGLPSFERLAEAASGGGSILMRLEGAAGSKPGQWQYGLPAGAYADEYIVACAGPNAMTVSLATESMPALRLGTVPCDGGVWRLAWDGTDEASILAATSVSILLEGQPGTAWRMLVVDDGTGRIVQHLGGSSRPFRLPAMDFIGQQRTAGAPELARGSGLNETAATQTTTLPGLGGAAAIEILLACSGGPVDVSLVSAGHVQTAAESGPMTCDGTLQAFEWLRDATTRAVSEAQLTVPSGTAWEAIAFDISANPPPGGPEPTPTP